MASKRRKIVKSIAKNAATIGSGMIVGMAVAAITPPGLRLIPKILISAGTAGIALVVGEAVYKGVDEYITAVEEAFSGVTIVVESPETKPSAAS